MQVGTPPKTSGTQDSRQCGLLNFQLPESESFPLAGIRGNTSLQRHPSPRYARIPTRPTPRPKPQADTLSPSQIVVSLTQPVPALGAEPGDFLVVRPEQDGIDVVRHFPLSAIAAVPEGAVAVEIVEPAEIDGLVFWTRLRRSYTRLGLRLVK